MIGHCSTSRIDRDRERWSRQETRMSIEGYLTPEDWTTLAKARDRAKRGLAPSMSAAQAELFKSRGFMAPPPHGRGGWILTDAGKNAVTNWERSRR
jgi:hypothetical protein